MTLFIAFGIFLTIYLYKRSQNVCQKNNEHLKLY